MQSKLAVHTSCSCSVLDLVVFWQIWHLTAVTTWNFEGYTLSRQLTLFVLFINFGFIVQSVIVMKIIHSINDIYKKEAYNIYSLYMNQWYCIIMSVSRIGLFRNKCIILISFNFYWITIFLIRRIPFILKKKGQITIDR